MAMNPASIGNPFEPTVTGEFLKQIILHQGISIIWRGKSSAIKCIVGWKSGHHDPDCSACGSKDGYTYIDKPRKVFLTQRDAHAGYNAENLTTVAGINERADYEMYTTFHHGRVMKLDDIIIYDRRYGQSKMEFIVMTKKEIFGTVGKKIGWKFLLFKSPKKITIPEVPFRQD